jgi:hypothetical protein
VDCRLRPDQARGAARDTRARRPPAVRTPQDHLPGSPPGLPGPGPGNRSGPDEDSDQASSRTKTPPDVLSAIGHPLAEEAAGSAAQFPQNARLDYATDVCKAILHAAELAARARGKQAKRLDDLFRHRRKLCAEALMVACALRSATCSEASVLWDLFTERLRKTRSLTRTLREVFDRTAAVGFVLENMARTT